MIFLVSRDSCDLPEKAVSDRQSDFLSSSYRGQSSIKCSSSSIAPMSQKRHILCSLGSFTYLPCSIRNLLDPPLNFTNSDSLPHEQGRLTRALGIVLSD